MNLSIRKVVSAASSLSLSKCFVRNHTYRAGSALIHVIKAETADGQVIKVIKDLHFSEIRTLKFDSELDLVISSDDDGCIEVWDPETYGKP